MITKLVICSMFFLSASAGYTQNAKVIQLSLSETAKAQELYRQKEEIDEKIELFREEVRHAHVPMVAYECVSIDGIRWSAKNELVICRENEIVLSGYDPAWENWEFSTDFRFIVPNTEKVCMDWAQ